MSALSSPLSGFQSEALKKLSEMTSSVTDNPMSSVLQKMTDNQNNNKSFHSMMSNEMQTDDVLAKSPDGKVTIRKEINGNDIQSLPSGLYGWTDIDGIKLPYVMRGVESFVSVRMVERLFLSRYPNQYPDEIKRVGPLVSHYASEQEASLMNEIGEHHLGVMLANEHFTTDELLVKLDQFSKFYTIVKSHFDKVPAAESTNAEQSSSPPISSTNKTIGWVQLNNTVIPYIKRDNAELLPISVVKHAANLLVTAKPRTMKISKSELEQLNKSCSEAGLQFTFTMKCKLVKLQRLRECESTNLYCVKVLPETENPFESATYKECADPVLESSSDSGRQSTTPPANERSSPKTMAIVNAAVEAAKSRHTVAPVSEKL